MGAALPVAMIAMQVASQVAGGIGANSEARAAAAADDENGRLSLLSGEQDVGQIMRDERMIAGDAMAAMGGSGLMVGTGSAADILADSAMQRERDIATRRAQATSQNANYRQSAKDKRAAGKSALIGSLFQAGATALTGARDIKNQRVQQSQVAKERATQLGQKGSG